MALAQAAGISRQSLGAIEAGRAEPSLSVAFALSRALELSVEELFLAQAPEPGLSAEPSDEQAARVGSRVTLAFIRERWVAHALPAPGPDAPAWAADGIVCARGRGARVSVEPLRATAEARDNVLLLGCAPGLGVIADRLNRTRGPGRFVWLSDSSTSALESFGKHHAQVAGVHSSDAGSGDPNTSAVRRALGSTRVELVTFARWQVGLVVARGNPRGISEVADLGRKGIRIVRREAGAGVQRLLEQRLKQAGLAPRRVLSRARSARGHLEAAFLVAIGAADVALTIEGAALVHGLDFLPLVEERFDLVLSRDAASNPRLGRLLEALQSAAFHRELSSLGGYDATECGHVVGGTAA